MRMLTARLESSGEPRAFLQESRAAQMSLQRFKSREGWGRDVESSPSSWILAFGIWPAISSERLHIRRELSGLAWNFHAVMSCDVGSNVVGQPLFKRLAIRKQLPRRRVA